MKLLNKLFWVLAFAVVITGCNSTPTTLPVPPTPVLVSAYPINTPSINEVLASYPGLGPYPTAIVPTPTFTPTPTATPFTSVSSLETLDSYPLRVGNFWSYSAVYYGYRIEGEGAGRVAVPITSTFVITDRVIATEINAPFFIAKLERTSNLIDGSGASSMPFNWWGVATPLAPDFLYPSGDWGIVNPNPSVYWYVIGGRKVYYQDELNLQKLQASPLYYWFPLSEHICWFPNGDETICKEHLSFRAWTNFYLVTQQSISQDTPVDSFTNCFDIQPYSRGGGFIKHFCLGVGLVGVEWKYGGQTPELYLPIGFRIELTDYFGAKK